MSIESDWLRAWTPKKIKKTWDEKRDIQVWNLDPAYRKVADAVWSLGRSVLDIGCGGGIQYAAFQDFTSDLAYRGIDIHPGMVAYARAAFPGVWFDEGSATELPYEDNQFEVSLLRHILEHHKPEQAELVLKEACRVASQGLVILFFKPPHNQVTNSTRHRRVTVTHFSRKWVIDTLLTFGGITVSRKFILKTAHARNDQELWTINLF